MACDGGTIPRRDELVKLQKKPEQKDSDGHRLYKWQYCAINQQMLTKPVVACACQMGRLYNTEAVISRNSECHKYSCSRTAAVQCQVLSPG